MDFITNIIIEHYWVLSHPQILHYRCHIYSPVEDRAHLSMSLEKLPQMVKDKVFFLGIPIASCWTLAHASLKNKNRTLTSIRMTKLLWTFPKLLLGSKTIQRSSTLLMNKPFHGTLNNKVQISFFYCPSKILISVSIKSKSKDGLYFQPRNKEELRQRKVMFEDSYCVLREDNNTKKFGHIIQNLAFWKEIREKNTILESIKLSDASQTVALFIFQNHPVKKPTMQPIVSPNIYWNF